MFSVCFKGETNILLSARPLYRLLLLAFFENILTNTHHHTLPYLTILSSRTKEQ
jgi:hypothetical protein